MAKKIRYKPSFYADIFQYLKAKDYFIGFNTQNIAGDNEDGNYPVFEDKDTIFTSNPYQSTKYNISDKNITNVCSFSFFFSKTPFQDIDHNPELNSLFSLKPLCLSILNHDLGDEGGPLYISASVGTDTEMHFYKPKNAQEFGLTDNPAYIKSTVNSSIHNEDLFTPNRNGYTIQSLETKYNPKARANRLKVSIDKVSGDARDDVRIGSIGLHYQFIPRYTDTIKATGSPNSRASLDTGLGSSTSYEGIATKKTIDGSEFSNFMHTGVPDWDDMPAWSIELDRELVGADQPHSYLTGRISGRRSWSVSFQYIDEHAIFNDQRGGNQNSFFNWSLKGSGWNYSTEEEKDNGWQQRPTWDTFMSLTMGGKIPFLFSPNIEEIENPEEESDSQLNNEQEFAMCIIKQDSIEFNQLTRDRWAVSFTVEEVW